MIRSLSCVYSTRLLFAASFAVVLFASSLIAQSDPKAGPAIVRPGAPGQETRTLPDSTKASLPAISQKDIEFMQGMIMHHAQAVEMTDLIGSRTENRSLRMIGARISQSQTDEMVFMKKWLEFRGQATEMKMAASTDSMNMHGGHSSGGPMLMPGMLTPKQMQALRDAKGAEFDRLFLKGMIQHHEGALLMVKELFESAGTGQDAELFNFASDVDTGQRAEIKSMQNLLGTKPVS